MIALCLAPAVIATVVHPVGSILDRVDLDVRRLLEARLGVSFQVVSHVPRAAEGKLLSVEGNLDRSPSVVGVVFPAAVRAGRPLALCAGGWSARKEGHEGVDDFRLGRVALVLRMIVRHGSPVCLGSGSEIAAIAPRHANSLYRIQAFCMSWTHNYSFKELINIAYFIIFVKS